MFVFIDDIVDVIDAHMLFSMSLLSINKLLSLSIIELINSNKAVVIFKSLHRLSVT